jgi:DNA-binding transcriptional LysR family regulator
MDRLKQIETFVAVATKGSLTAAANAESVAPAVIGRRLDALEERLGVKLLVRTTRKITVTHEGSAYLEDCQRILRELGDAEASVAAGGVKAAGHVRVTAPAGFGRKHVAPLVPKFMAQHPDVTVSLDMSDRVVDVVNEGFDCAVRVGDLPDSSLVSIRLADNRRVCVATPSYLKRAGTPKTPQELANHNCLAFSSVASQPRGWVFQVLAKESGDKPEILHMRVSGNMDCTDGEALLDWCRAGHGIAWRSWWEVGAAVSAGELVTVLDDFAAPPNGIYAVFPQRKHLPLRVRLWVEFLKHSYAQLALAGGWK